MNACFFDSQNPAATWSRALRRCDISLRTVTTCGMRAQAGVKQTSTTEQLKKKGITRASLKQGPQRYQTCLSQRPKQQCLSQRPKQQCLSQRPEGREILVSTPQDTGCLRTDSHLLNTSTNAEGGNAFQLIRNSWTLYNQKTSVAPCVATSQRLAVTAKQTIADE